MKKYFIILVLLLLVGCGKKSNDVVCVINNNSGYDYKEEITATIDADKVTSVSSELSFDSEIDALMHCESLKAYKDYKNDRLSYECFKKSITIDNYNEMTDLDTSIIGLTKQEFIDLFTSYQYACK